MAFTAHCLLLLLLPICSAAGDSAADLRRHRQRPAAEPPLLRPSSSGSSSGGAAAAAELKLQRYSSEEVDAVRLLAADADRAAFIQARIAAARRGGRPERASKALMPLVSGAKLQTLNYVTTVELGSEAVTVIVDTGSDLTWVQCKPCSACRDQTGPLFDPSTSRSYRAVPCNSSLCGALAPAAGTKETCGAAQPDCSYALSYSDGSYSSGVLAQDSIGLAGREIRGFVFGCGTSNQGLFGGASGLMGLGRSELSLVSQTAKEFSGAFSYCLPSKDFNSFGSLVLGDDPASYRNSTPFVYARMISDPAQGPFYFLNLTGIAVGGARIDAGAGSTTIDSGTVISRVAPSAYRAIKAEFSSKLAKYPAAPGFSILDSCFNLTGYRDVQLPRVRLEFDSGAAAVEIDPAGVMYVVKKDLSQVCLAMAPLASEDETGIIGNYQQRNLRIMYDTANSVVGFAEETCDHT